MHFRTRYIPLDKLQGMLDEVRELMDEIRLQRPSVNVQKLLRILIIYRVGMDKVANNKLILKWIDTGYFPYWYYEQTAVRRITYSNGFVERDGMRIHPGLPKFPFSLTANINSVQFDWMDRHMEIIE